MDGDEKAVACFDLIDELRELPGVDLATGCERRPIRSAVERGSTVIGEAITVLSGRDCGPAARISQARLISGFRNRHVLEYPQVDDESVYAIGRRDAPVPRAECVVLLQEMGDVD